MGAALLACLGFLAIATPAWGDTYVDAVNGDDSNDCLTPATSCATIGLGVIFATSNTDTVHVESGTYPRFNLPRGLSVIADEFNANNADPPPLIQGDGTGPAVNVLSEPATPGRIEGFTIRGTYGAMDIADSITVANNTFDQDVPGTRPAFGQADVLVTGGAVTFRGNTFDDPQPIDDQHGIVLQGGALTIENNTFDGFRQAIDARGVSNLSITGNTITGLHQADLATPPDPPNLVDGFGIVLIDSTAELVDNRFHSPALGGAPVGVFVLDSDSLTPPLANTALRRTRIVGHGRGVWFSGTVGASSLEGDLIANNSQIGITFGNPDPPLAPLSIENATIYANGQDLELLGAALTMDSTAVDDPIAIPPADPATCAITHSRGPTTSGNPCETFQTAAAPAFADAPAGDFHLLAGSPLTDAGDPAAPAAGAIDLDGDPRALDGDCDGLARRDIGADEAARDCPPPAPPANDSTPPETTIDSGPKKKSRKKRARFTFSASEQGSRFECSLDRKEFTACTSPARVRVKRGKHRFEVRAIDAAGNADLTPAARKFRVVR